MEIQLTQTDVPAPQLKRTVANVIHVNLKEHQVSARHLGISSTIKDPRNEQIELAHEDFVLLKSCSNAKAKQPVPSVLH